MERAGLRYKNLASRCRQSASVSDSPPERAALLRMAEAYDRRAGEIEAVMAEGRRKREAAGPASA